MLKIALPWLIWKCLQFNATYQISMLSHICVIDSWHFKVVPSFPIPSFQQGNRQGIRQGRKVGFLSQGPYWRESGQCSQSFKICGCFCRTFFWDGERERRREEGRERERECNWPFFKDDIWNKLMVFKIWRKWNRFRRFRLRGNIIQWAKCIHY